MRVFRQQTIIPDLSTKKRSWKRRVDVLMVWYFGVIVCLSTLNALESLKITHLDFVKTKSNAKIFLQFLFCFTQLQIIVGLCLDGGKSFASKFLRTRLMKFLG